ncbi:hypothetical protein KPL26_04705 [Clostridium algidicarnis]|uniref:hypothetical protein n=1 Tax=Clostridium algidicarnis TaxID=37659 RepID=UPI001C0E272F|nr:hypothetical protein [Clostridium algidicarnis]MBU3195967.1 hypothetical protein [Clostridium algidicarnis]
MVRLIGFELKKIISRPSSIIMLLIILAINCITIFLGTGDIDIQFKDKEIYKAEQSQYAGEINQIWRELIQLRLQTVIDNPDNLMTLDEKKEVKEYYLQQGYTKDYVDNLPNILLVKSSVEYSIAYRVIRNAEYDSRFYNNARNFSINIGNNLRRKFQGKKGDVIGGKAEKMYSNLAKNYTAYYNYHLGWDKLSSMQRILPFTVGVFLFITLSPIFSLEYSCRTDSLLLSSKHGKSKLAHAKILTGFFMAIGIWIFVQLTNLVMVASLFSLKGAETFVQDWVNNYSPFPFTQLTNYIAVSFMSFIGVMFFASIILFISSRAKSPFVSILVGGVVLLSPIIIEGIGKSGGSIYNVLMFMPVNVLIATQHFSLFNAYYVFKNAFLMQLAVPLVAIIISAIIIPIACQKFQHHQVEN